MRPFVPVAMVALAAAAAVALGADAQPTPAPTPPVAEVVPRAKFERAVEVMRRQARRADRLARILGHTEDYQATLILASIVYPRADVRLADRIMRCESGPGRGTPSATAQNPTSSAGGRAQYLDTTWRSTPEGQAGLSRFDPVAGVFAIMRHLHNTGNDASPWFASKRCWS